MNANAGTLAEQSIALINEAAARSYFATSEDPIGRRFGDLIENRAQIEIVGIVSE